MKSIVAGWNRRLTWCQRLADAVGVFLLVTILVSALVEVLTRGFFNMSFAWSGPAASASFAWMAFIGAASAVWTNSNLEVTYFRELIPNVVVRRIVELFALLCTLLFGAIFAWAGILLISANQNAIVTGLGLSYPIVYSITVVSGGFMGVFAIGRATNILTARGRVEP